MSQLVSQRTYLYLLYNEIIYDPICKEYNNILTLNKNPEGELKNYTKSIAVIKPSPTDLIRTECTIAIKKDLLNNHNNHNNHNNSTILTLSELNDLTEFLINNNYTITTIITNLYENNNLKKIIYSFKITL